MISSPIPIYIQKEIKLPTLKRGCHYITEHVIKAIPEIKKIKIGLCNIFLKHTSASLAINENYDPSVKEDMENALNRIAKEDMSLYEHTLEGPDDMPAHIKCALIGTTINIPITDGNLNLGTWQGIWLLEHKSGKLSREIVITAHGI